ncbi:MAG TPA: hypothetical protein VFV19_13990 [Candidatus Polarisedimenticolaceae bacterium]|nr:hypothetical protein [Candidatus Polarisedimenticolaceae bacterium]
MRRKIFVMAIVAVATVGIGSLMTASPAAASSCPRGSHLITCPNGHSFCCPNNALCICFPY